MRLNRRFESRTNRNGIVVFEWRHGFEGVKSSTRYQLVFIVNCRRVWKQWNGLNGRGIRTNLELQNSPRLEFSCCS